MCWFVQLSNAIGNDFGTKVKPRRKPHHRTHMAMRKRELCWLAYFSLQKRLQVARKERKHINLCGISEEVDLLSPLEKKPDKQKCSRLAQFCSKWPKKEKFRMKLVKKHRERQQQKMEKTLALSLAEFQASPLPDCCPIRDPGKSSEVELCWIAYLSNKKRLCCVDKANTITHVVWLRMASSRVQARHVLLCRRERGSGA